MSQSPLRLGFLLVPLALACFAFSAQPVSLAPDGGYANGDTAASEAVPLVGRLFQVNSLGDGDDANLSDGRCETATAGECTLRAAIEQINHDNNSADSIGFNIPTAQPWTVFVARTLPDLTSGMSIIGPGSATLIIDGGRQGNFAVRVFNVTTTGTVNISGLTIADGLAPLIESGGSGSGGGIQNFNTGTVNISNCILNNNSAANENIQTVGGGAIFNNSTGTINITNSTFSSNQASCTGATVCEGGAIYNKTGTVNVTNSTFLSNNADLGGGIFNQAGVIKVTGSTFEYNGVTNFGGGVCTTGGTASIVNSTFYANVAHRSDGGGLGAGIVVANTGTVLNLSNSTITQNFSPGVGGGVYSGSGASVNIKSTIIALNYGPPQYGGPDVWGSFSSQGFNLIGKKDGSTGFTAATDKKGTITSPLNPKLDPKGLRSNGGPTQTIALVNGSPAIDKGTSVGLTGTLTTDQRGFARTVDKSEVPNATGGDGTDIGAFELP